MNDDGQMAAPTERDGEGDVEMGSTGSRADDQVRGEVEENDDGEQDTTAKNDDGQVAAPTERDGEDDVVMGSTGSRADNQGRGEVEANEQASGGAAAATVGAPKKKSTRRGTSNKAKGRTSRLAKQRRK
jgi:hypothetical protein